MTPDYELIEELSRNKWHTLSRGRRRKDHQPVLLKVTRHDPPGVADVELLEREFESLRSLSFAGIPRAYELLRFEGGCGLVLEDPGGLPLTSLFASRRPDLGSFFGLAIQLASILAELHKRDIIHRNVNPRSILLDPTDGQVALIDLGLASRSSAEIREPIPSTLLRGTVAYSSPEQTGRMNRSPDYRTDFYSLGVTLYELLTGAPPFASDDSLELIHWHIAKTPPPPDELDPAIPKVVSQVVMKLMAKTAEERYQSALGLKHDLEVCARAWAAKGEIPAFALGEYDTSDRFLISQKLYGREREVEELLGKFEQVCQGPTSMMLVHGYSGIGKTSLIQELYKPIVRQRGYYISGKFDQVARNTPFGAMIQAFRGLVQQLLTESEERLAQWRTRLSQALGGGGSVLAEVIPEIELIVGKQPQPPALGPTEALNRFQLAFQNFVGTIARREHPLVVFLDDLQWADSATLSLLQPLLTSPDVQCLFLIGAYRDNEVDAAHPLMRTLGALEAAGGRLHDVTLGPLRLQDLKQFIRDTLHGSLENAAPLARLVLEKTDGNPFFAIQFLKTLKQDGVFEFDYEQGCWAYRIEAIADDPLSDNIIDLMTLKIQRLSPKTQQALTLAACIGSPFDASTLAIVSRQSPEAAAADLKEALDEGLVLSRASHYEDSASLYPEPGTQDAAYAFLHDRVQQAAYALIPEERKQSVHLNLGRLLRERLDSRQGEERIFDIVHHLNLGSSLILNEDERLAVARLNLSAGRKAKSATAYEAALGCFKAGARLLGEERWESDYDLTFALHLEAAECQYLCGNFDEAELEFDALLERARTSLDKARVYGLRSVQYENLSRYEDALAVARHSLALFGVSFPDAARDKQAALEGEIEAIQSLLAGRPIESLIELPAMTDAEVRMVMNILTDIWSSTYIIGDHVLARLMSATMVRLSLLHGNSEESAYGYVTHAITVGPVRGDYESAYEFGRLALRVNERFDDSRRRAKIHQQFHAHVNLWRRPMQTCIPYAREACRSGLESGDFLYAAYGASTETWPAFVSTENLAQFVRDYSPNLALIKKLKITSFADALKIMLNWARALAGETDAPLSLSSAEFDEREYLETYRGNPFFTTFHAVARLHLCYLFGEYKEALEAARTARENVYHLSGTIWPVIFDFWNGLTLAANYEEAGEEEREAYLGELEKTRQSFTVLAENCAENFLCQSLLLRAEIERVAGRPLSALELYEQAGRYARETSVVQHQALAAELCARFQLGRGERDAAVELLAEARDSYARWGAAAKVAELEREFPDLPGRRPGASPRVSPARQVSSARALTEPEAGTLDLLSVMKAAQAIAGEIESEKLLATLMRIAIENAGAERGSLILEQDGQPFVRAEGWVDAPARVTAHGGVPLSEAASLPEGIVNYVRRTSEPVVLADAQADDRYVNDPYIMSRRPRSVLCTPVLNQGRLIGVLYLENNLVTSAFTPDRIQVMQMLSAQAAVAIENAELFAEVRRLRDRLQAENVYLQEEIRREHNFEEMVGGSPALLDVLRKVEQVAHTDAIVLVYGETGTGKELIARAIHNLSARRDRPLVKINCGAISAGLVESELFGHVKGAFTGAVERRTGRFELADGGTLFLDEIGELPLDTQVKLLRVLQEQEFEPVGSSRSIRVDVRVIAATNRDLEQAVREGRFRSDLFYRLNVFPLRVPPLRERLSDVPQLVLYFLVRYSKKFGKKIESVSQETMERLVNYSWPGNIRELQNVIERAVVLTTGPVLKLDRDLLPVSAPMYRVAGAEGGIISTPASAGDDSRSVLSATTTQPPLTLEDVERRHILAVLEMAGGVVEGPKGAAKVLNLHPNTLRSRMKKLGIGRAGHEIS
jgi:predicted ATPase/transcriptional regulator with GAF, ATPase, and Fis domain